MTLEGYFYWCIWFCLLPLQRVINYSETMLIISMSLHQWPRYKFMHSTLIVLGKQKTESEISDLRPKRFSGTLLCFRAIVNAGCGLYIHLSEQTTGGTVTKTGWFWASRFFYCDSKAICHLVFFVCCAAGCWTSVKQ